MLATSFQARSNNGMSFLHNSYVSNAVAYANSFAGGMVKVVAAVVLDEGQKYDVLGNPEDKTKGKHAKSFSVNIAPISGLDIAVAYIDVSKFSDLGILGLGLPSGISVDTDANATKVGVKYAMGPFSVAYQHEMLNKGLTAPSIPVYGIFGIIQSDKGSVDYVTGTFKVNDANAINLAYGKTSKEVGALGTSDGSIGNKGDLLVVNTDKDPTYMAVDFNHSFSKNTSVFVGYRVSDAGTAMAATIDMTTGAVTGLNLAVPTKETAIGAGLRVNF
jgi:predicted porin